MKIINFLSLLLILALLISLVVLTLQLEELQKNYLDLNISYYDLIKRIQPYIKINPEKQLNASISSIIVTTTIVTTAKIPTITVNDSQTGLSFQIVEPTWEELMIFNKINEERAKHNLTQLRLNKAISYVARKHSEDMSKRSYFSHKTPEGITLSYRLANNSLYFMMAGENIALMDEEYLNETVDDWMQSPGHRTNILEEDYNEVGIGVYCTFNGTYCYVTADFVNTVEERKSKLDPKYLTFLYLFDPATDIGFAQPIKLRIKFNSTQPLDFYLLASHEDWKYYIDTGNKHYIDYLGKVSNLEREFVVYKNYGIMLENNEISTAYYNITIQYLSV